MMARFKLRTRIAIAAIYLGAFWFALERIEKAINPVGWDLQTLQTIRGIQQKYAERQGQ